MRNDNVQDIAVSFGLVHRLSVQWILAYLALNYLTLNSLAAWIV